MSGPTTVLITGEPVTVLLAAAAIRAADAVYQGYAHAANLHQEHAAGREAIQAAQHSAHQKGHQALQAEAAALEEKFERLIALAERLNHAEQVRATHPERPQDADPISLAAYIRALAMLVDDLESIILTESARQLNGNVDQPSEFAMPIEAAASPQLPSQNVSSTVAQRLLARIAHMGQLPQQLTALAKELDATLPGERAELLASELRRQIQIHIEAVQKRMVQEATATVVEQSLKDLGYQVEEIADTLFVEGGVVHFRRQGWGDYMVRMRVNAKSDEANFNVIRAVEAGNNERSVQDHIAEDRWCTEFPALLKSLEIRGVKMHVTRRLEAGELPVQLVDASKLPKFSEEENTSSTTRLKEREIK